MKPRIYWTTEHVTYLERQIGRAARELEETCDPAARDVLALVRERLINLRQPVNAKRCAACGALYVGAFCLMSECEAARDARGRELKAAP